MATLNQTTVADESAKLLAKLRTSRQAGIVESTAPVTETKSLVCLETCPDCHGANFVRYDLPIEHPQFGRLHPCPQSPNRSRLHPSGLFLSEIDTLEWDSIRPVKVTGLYKGQVKPSTMDAIARAVLRYLANYEGGMVYLHGDYGIGKSLILKTAIADQVRKSKVAYYTTMGLILSDIQEGFNHDDPREGSRARYQRTLEWPFLAVDELEKINRSDWAGNQLFQFLDARYEQAVHQQTHTLLASNISPEDLGGAIASRIRDGRCLVIEIQGSDQRPNMTWE